MTGPGASFENLRVRHHGDVARIELPVADLPRAVVAPLREAVQSAVASAGFRFAALDLAGVQSGAFTLPLIDSEEHHDRRRSNDHRHD